MTGLTLTAAPNLPNQHKTKMKTKHLDSKVLEAFKNQLRGELITPDNDRYNMFRRVHNGMIDKKPALIVRCQNIADILYSLEFGKTHNIPIAIRSGGHNAGGLGVADNSIVIDLGLMNSVQVDLKFNTVRVEAGCVLGDIDHALQPFGKAFPSGNFSTTGISGLTLGGGLGHLSRAYGLTIDSLLEADIVLADGRLITVDQQNYPDLFWAIRGGGGNFGIVVSFLFELHPAGTIHGGPMLWHIEDAQQIMPFYRDFILKAPKEIYCYFAFLTVPPVPLFPEHLHLKKMCGTIWCNLGNIKKSNQALEQFRNFKTPALDYTDTMPYVQLQSLLDDLYPAGLQWYWKGAFIKDLNRDAIGQNIKYANLLPTPHSTVHFYPINGACHSKSNKDTAWANRDANWSQVIVGVDPDPTNNDKLIHWAKSYWEAIHPYSLGGGYINFMMEEGQDQVRASYRDNYDKLLRIKQQYDPNNVFRVNHNIRP